MNNRIRIARGDNISAKTDAIEAGVPVYDTTKHTMRVGTGKTGEGTIANTPALSLEDNAVLGTPGTPSAPSDTTKTRKVSDIFETDSNTVKSATNVTSTVSGSAKLGTTTGNTNTTDRQPDHIFETNSNTVKDASNVSSTINGNLITEIFDGVKAKAVNCVQPDLGDFFPFEWSNDSSASNTNITWFSELPGGQTPAQAVINRYNIGTNFIVSKILLPICPFTGRGWFRIIGDTGIYKLSDWFGTILSVNVTCSSTTLNKNGTFTYNNYPPVVTFDDTDGIYMRVFNADNSFYRTCYIITILSCKDLQ